MITRNDLLMLLAELEDNGIDTKEAVRGALRSLEPQLETIKFINDNRQIDLSRFYEKIRKSYNKKKSMLYANIVKEIDDPNEVLTTLSAMLTQILLFAKDADDRVMFLKHSRADEISKILNIYFQTYDLTNCIRLLRLIKTDIKALESIR